MFRYLNLNTHARSLALAQERGNVLLLTVYNIHCLVSVVQIVPTWCLVRRISSPDLAKRVRMLCLWTVQSSVSPGTGTDIRAIVRHEVIHSSSNDRLQSS